MASPPGTFQIVVGSSTGNITVIVNFDPTTGAIRNVGSPPAALSCDNQTGRVCPVIVTGTGQPTTINVPVGVTTRTAAQLAAVGITTRDDLSYFSVAVPAA
jgi:hypothetical protein